MADARNCEMEGTLAPPKLFMAIYLQKFATSAKVFLCRMWNNCMVDA
jgi:hypothetical protein